MVPSVEPFPSFFCQLYHDEVGIHTFEVHYHFSLPDEQALLQYIWKNIITTSPRCPHNRQMVSLIPGLHAQMLSTDVGQILKLIINPRVMVDGTEGYCRITDSDANTIRNCIKKFNRYWKDHNITPIRLKSCRLTRMDLCMNIEFGDDFSIPMYLDLLKRTPHDRRLSQQHMKDPEDDHHVYKISNLRRGLVVYDKLYEQQKRFHKQEFDCQNLMRIEYQLGTRALRYTGQCFVHRSFLSWSSQLSSFRLVMMAVTTATVKATSASATLSEIRKSSAQIHGIHPPCKIK